MAGQVLDVTSMSCVLGIGDRASIGLPKVYYV